METEWKRRGVLCCVVLEKHERMRICWFRRKNTLLGSCCFEILFVLWIQIDCFDRLCFWCILSSTCCSCRCCSSIWNESLFRIEHGLECLTIEWICRAFIAEWIVLNNLIRMIIWLIRFLEDFPGFSSFRVIEFIRMRRWFACIVLLSFIPARTFRSGGSLHSHWIFHKSCVGDIDLIRKRKDDDDE